MPQATTIAAPHDTSWQIAARYASMGIEMGVCIAIGYGAGAWLDGKLGSEPWLMLVGVLLGVAAAFRAVMRVARAARQDVR